MMRPSELRQKFRAVLAGDTCVHPGSVFDPISARIAADIGFETGIFAGSVASLAVLGAPDLIVLTLTEFAEQIRRITRAADLPLLVDADHGYGNALNVMRTVQELETAGVAAMTIEDTELPRPYGDGTTRLVSLAEGLGKIRGALAARTDPALVIVARTSAMTASGLDEAAARARTYTEAGADALFFTGVTSLDQLRAIQAVSPLPIILGGGTHPAMPPRWPRMASASPCRGTPPSSRRCRRCTPHYPQCAPARRPPNCQVSRRPIWSGNGPGRPPMPPPRRNSWAGNSRI
jgi:carboxyvinyl-carboxyphosphonate phosphorylmutase